MVSKRKTGVSPRWLQCDTSYIPQLAQAAHDELVPVRQVPVEALKPTTLVILSCPPSATLPVFPLGVLLIVVAVHLPLVFFLL